jgi:hypothetical protein
VSFFLRRDCVEVQGLPGPTTAYPNQTRACRNPDAAAAAAKKAARPATPPADSTQEADNPEPARRRKSRNAGPWR